MVSISIDPEHDTPARLNAYAAKFHAGPQWRFLTGSLPDTIAVQKAFDAYRGEKASHVPLTFLHASPGAPWVRIEGFVSAGELMHEYRALVAR
jgi:protein SCO1/2